MPVERQSPEACQAYVRLLQSGQVGTVRHSSFALGQYTDDSQLMRELVMSLVACDGFDPVDYAQRIARIYATGQIIGSSSAGTKVAQRLTEGVPWNQAGTPAPYAINGSAMRVAPIGLFFYDRPEQLIQAAIQQSYITHQDPRACAGAVAIAGAVALAVQLDAIHPPTFLQQLSAWVKSVDSSIAENLLQLIDWIDLPPDAAFDRILPSGNPPESLKDWEGISPWIVPSILWSLYAFLHSPQDYWQTVCTAIAGGGDADTTAAMAGAISGAFLGLEAISTEIAYRLTDQGKWGYEPLLALADLGFHLSRVQQMAVEESMRARWAAADKV